MTNFHHYHNITSVTTLSKSYQGKFDFDTLELNKFAIVCVMAKMITYK